MNHSDSIGAISTALAEFQEGVGNIPKTAKNPHFQSMFAPLDAIVSVINELGPKHGLSHVQSVGSDEQGRSTVTTLLMHKSGEWIQSDPLTMPLEKATAQGSGSGITYGRRYQLPAIYGLATEDDDDGNAASHDATAPAAPAPTQAAKSPQKASDAQVAAIWAKAKGLGHDEKWVVAQCVKAFGADAHPDTLTKAQAKTILDGLAKLEEQRKETAHE